MSKIFDIRNLCFAYYKNPLCLNDISFVVNEKQKVLILGAQEMGKTTFLKALSSFDDTYLGQIFYKGKDLNKYEDNEKHFSLLLSEPVFFNSTIRKNLDYLCELEGKKILSDDELQDLLTKFYIECNPKTKIKSMTISQKRKLAFLRAWIKKPEVLFIDDQFEALEENDCVEMADIIEKFFKLDVTIIMAFGNETMEKHFMKLNVEFDKVVYLSFSKAYEYKSIQEFFDKKHDYFTLTFSDKFDYVEAKIVKDGASYFLAIDDSYLKFGKIFYDRLSMLMLQDDEVEDVFVCFDKKKVFDKFDNDMFDKRLKNNDLWIFSKLDKSRII